MFALRCGSLWTLHRPLSRSVATTAVRVLSFSLDRSVFERSVWRVLCRRFCFEGFSYFEGSLFECSLSIVLFFDRFLSFDRRLTSQGSGSVTLLSYIVYTAAAVPCCFVFSV
ncbi:unnamed protein product [Laminaria digitata]